MSLLVTILAAAAAFEPPAPRRGAGPAANAVLSRRALLPALATGSAALLAASAAQPASAGTGAAGAAVVSVPELLRLTAEEWLKLPTDKALQRIGSLTEERVTSIAEQLEEIIADQSLERLAEMKKKLEADSNDYNATSSYAELQALEAQAARSKSAIALAREVSKATPP